LEDQIACVGAGVPDGKASAVCRARNIIEPSTAYLWTGHDDPTLSSVFLDEWQ
jgi:hypothetical protein